MNIDTEILQTVVTMPEHLQKELLHYAKYLMENYSKDVPVEQYPVKKTSLRHITRDICSALA